MMVECELALPEPVRSALDTLPPDVIRIIVRQVGYSVRNLRLISRRWNAIASEYIQFRLPLDSVRIIGDGSSNVALFLKFKKPIDKQHFQGVCRGWNTQAAGPLCPFSFFSRAFDAHHLLVFHLAFSAQFAYWIALKRAVRSNRHRLARMFARCSTIDEVCLQYLNMQRLDVIRNTLGGVTIKHLIVYEDECDEELRDALIDMCQKHNVQQISLCVKNFKDLRLSKLIQEIAVNAPRLEIYERTTCEDNIFGLSREFWEKKKMNSERFSTKVVSEKSLRIDCAAFSYREHWLRFEIETI